MYFCIKQATLDGTIIYFKTKQCDGSKCLLLRHENCFFWPICRLKALLRIPHFLSVASANSVPYGTQILLLYIPLIFS
jgi:hypothetical protein